MHALRHRHERKTSMAVTQGVHEPSLLQRSLNLLCMLQMRVNHRANFFQQTLQFHVLGVWNQRLVYRIEHGLMVGHFVINIGLVKLFPLQAFEFAEIGRAAIFKRLACVAVLRRYFQFLD